MAIHGILGDIHGNREALVAALAGLEALGVERLACVGDLVGYNPDADDCVALLRELGVASIAGNHDLIGTGQLGFERCSNKAMHSLKRTRSSLAAGTRAYLEALPSHLALEPGVLLTHGGVRDVQQYMTKPKHLLENASYLRADFPGARICFFGHTHEQRVFEVEGGQVRERDATHGVTLHPEPIYFINPGSVDASRKRLHKLAEFAVFDSLAGTVHFHQAPYDEQATEAKARDQGFRIDGWRDRLYDVQRRLIGPRHVEGGSA